MFSNLTVSLNVLCAEGVAVGCGWQAFVAYVNVGCYYLIGVPLGVLLGFTFDLGVKVIYIIPLLDISGLVFPY
jgi:Na+-driven multidrug efflux pump